MTTAALARGPAPRHLRPGLRRGLMMGASLALHVGVLGSMILLAADDGRPPDDPPLPPIIQLEIERPPRPRNGAPSLSCPSLSVRSSR